MRNASWLSTHATLQENYFNSEEVDTGDPALWGRAMQPKVQWVYFRSGSLWEVIEFTLSRTLSNTKKYNWEGNRPYA